jgi:uncharacterized delta-60 repeat protein
MTLASAVLREKRVSRSTTHVARVAKAALFVFSFALLLAGGTPVMRGQSALDGFDPNANGTVRVVVVQPDGKILLGGEFTSVAPNGGAAVPRNYIARLNPDGTLDTAFNPNANGIVVALALQADGKILAGGFFNGANSIGGQTRNHIARLDATTGLADSFDPNASCAQCAPPPAVISIAVQADGKILAGGYFTAIGGQARNHIARLDTTTGLADSFDPNADFGVLSIALQTDGKILVGGGFSNIGGETRNRIARLDVTTGRADSFNANASSAVSSVYSIAVQADGKILVGGSFGSMGGETRNGMARLEATTGLADSFDPSVNGTVFSIAVQADGKILASGSFNTIGFVTRNNVARLDAATGLPDSFNPNASSSVYSIAVQADGKILVGGFFTGIYSIAGQTRNRIARLETDGGLDQTLNLSVIGNPYPADPRVVATAVQPDGKILIGGEFNRVMGVDRHNIARLNADGTLDTVFDPNPDGHNVTAIVVQGDGKILVAGNFSSIGGQLRSYFARLDGTTGQADSFNPGADGSVYAITVQADGTILVGGAFRSIGGEARNSIARLDGTTGLADSFDPNASNLVFSIAVQADGRILVGGDFRFIGGEARNSIARLDATTGLADSFNPDANDYVSSIAVQADGKILVGGFFTSIGGQARNYMARFDATTGLLDPFNPNPSAAVFSIVLQADVKILLGGAFTSIGGQARRRVARVDPTTGLADSFDPNANATVNSIAVQTDGKVLAGGNFTTMGGQSRGLFARLSNDIAAVQDLSATKTTVTWARGGSSLHFTRVTFEFSADNVNYTPLGNGTPQSGSSNWILTGLNLPTGQNIYIRARGYGGSAPSGSESMIESVRNAFLAPAPHATNLSSRMRVETGDNIGIGGFIITGSGPKQVLLRAIGPSLTGSGVPNVLVDPVLELHGPAGFATISNDNWRDTQAVAIQATGLAPTNDFESAVLVTLNPGAYTAIVKGKNNTSGVGLVELYDLDQAAASKLGNISTRAFVSTGADIVIAGFILGGNPPQAGSDDVVLRGIGPSLSSFGVPNVLANPTLELRNSNGALLAYNNDWQDNNPPVPPAMAPGSPLESVIVSTLPPGLYTTLLAGLNNGTGVGLIEVYDRGAP